MGDAGASSTTGLAASRRLRRLAVCRGSNWKPGAAATDQAAAAAGRRPRPPAAGSGGRPRTAAGQQGRQAMLELPRRQDLRRAGSRADRPQETAYRACMRHASPQSRVSLRLSHPAAGSRQLLAGAGGANRPEVCESFERRAAERRAAGNMRIRGRTELCFRLENGARRDSGPGDGWRSGMALACACTGWPPRGARGLKSIGNAQ